MAWQATAVGPRLRAGDGEGRVVRAAAAGQPDAAAALLRRHEEGVFNLGLRITGDERDAADAAAEAFVAVLERLTDPPEREPSFRTQWLAATCKASHDASDGRRRGDAEGDAARLDEGMAPDAELEEEDLLLEDWQEEIGAANARLPARQREVLALQGLAGLTYAEIGEVLDMDRDAVVQLVAAARLGLHDELRHSALAGRPMPSEDCGPALGLMAMRDDAELAEDSEDSEWLLDHLVGCRDCRLLLDAMQDARLSYSAWQPVPAPASLFDVAMSRAAALLRERDARRGAAPAAFAGGGATQAAAGAGDTTQVLHPRRSADEAGRRRRRELMLAGGWGGALVVGLLALLIGGVFGGGEGREEPAESTLEPPAQQLTPPEAEKRPRARPARKRDRKPEPAQPRAVVQQPPRQAPVRIVRGPVRERRAAAPRRQRTRRRQVAPSPRGTPAPAPQPAPEQPASEGVLAPGGTQPTPPAGPAPQAPPPKTCTNPAGAPTPC